MINANELFQLVVNGNLTETELKLFINNGGDINKSIDNKNLLHYAVIYNRIEIVNFLLKCGANISNGIYLTAFDLPSFDNSENDRIEILKLFLKFGFDPDIKLLTTYFENIDNLIFLLQHNKFHKTILELKKLNFNSKKITTKNFLNKIK